MTFLFSLILSLSLSVFDFSGFISRPYDLYMFANLLGRIVRVQSGFHSYNFHQ